MYKKNNRNVRIVIIVSVFLLLVSTYFISSILMTKDYIGQSRRMFSDIDSLQILLTYCVDKLDDDKNVMSLNTVEKFSYQIEFNEKEFKVYAYEFEDGIQSNEYIERTTGLRFTDNESYYMTSNSFFRTKYIAFSNENVLYVIGPDIKSTYEFLSYIEQSFDIEL